MREKNFQVVRLTMAYDPIDPSAQEGKSDPIKNSQMLVCQGKMIL